jgi:hypothetical protein
MANQTNGNQFRDDEIIILDQLRDGKMVKNIFPKIGERLRLAHENDQLSITTEIIKYDENLAVVKAVSTTRKGSFPGIGMASVDREGIKVRILSLRKDRPLRNADIRNFTDLGRLQAYRIMKELESDDLVYQEGHGQAALWYLKQSLRKQ